MVNLAEENLIKNQGAESPIINREMFLEIILWPGSRVIYSPDKVFVMEEEQNMLFNLDAIPNFAAIMPIFDNCEKCSRDGHSGWHYSQLGNFGYFLSLDPKYLRGIIKRIVSSLHQDNKVSSVILNDQMGIYINRDRLRLQMADLKFQLD